LRLSKIMILRIKKLGPIKEGEIELGDITLLLGPPNTGKSYTLKAIYAKLFPLDDYALDITKGILSSILVRRLEHEIPEHALSKLHELLETIIKILIVILLSSKSSKAYNELERFITTIAEKKGFQVMVERRREFLLINVSVIPIEINLSAEILSQALQEAVYEFTSRLIPVENIDSIAFEPIDVSGLDADYITRITQHETEKETKRIRLLFWFEELPEFLYHIIRMLMHKYESLRRQPSVFLIERYLRYLTRYFDIATSLKVSIQPDAKNLRLVFLFSPLRFRVPLLPILEKVVEEGIGLEDIGRVVEEVFETAKNNLRLSRAINRIIDTMKSAMLTTCVNAISRNILYDGLRELVRSGLGCSSLRFIPFGRSIFVLGIESASREPFTRSRNSIQAYWLATFTGPVRGGGYY